MEQRASCGFSSTYVEWPSRHSFTRTLLIIILLIMCLILSKTVRTEVCYLGVPSFTILKKRAYLVFTDWLTSASVNVLPFWSKVTVVIKKYSYCLSNIIIKFSLYGIFIRDVVEEIRVDDYTSAKYSAFKGIGLNLKSIFLSAFSSVLGKRLQEEFYLLLGF